MERKRIITSAVVIFLLISAGRHARAEVGFGSPKNLGPDINSTQDEYCVDVSDDGLCLLFSDSPFSWRPGGRGNIDIWMSIRQATDEPFGPPINVSELNTGHHEFSPTLSVDGLTIFFSSNRPGGRGDMDLWMAIRPTRTAPFGQPVNLGSVNSGSGDFCPCLSADGLSLYFNSSRWGGYGSCDLYVAKRETVNSPWRTPVNLGSRINSNQTDGNPQISDDGLRLFYSSKKSGGFGEEDLYVVTRETVDSSWGNPVNMGPLFNTTGKETSISICPKACTMFICSARLGGVGMRDIWEIPIGPIVDFNGDGKVGEVELAGVVEHWHTDAVMYDVAPAPFGNGFVDVQDLLVFAECVSAAFLDPTLLAHWALDETEGDISYNSIGDNYGILSGNPTWQPDSGQVAGALEFDGIDDYISTDFVLNPKDGAFSVFAWTKGGAPGQVVISQLNGANWLGTDPASGGVMTELIPPAVGRFVPQPLKSESVITDGQWHRIGFVWDGIYRKLYVDDILVAEDLQAELSNSFGGLNIGRGNNPSAGTYFSGLIDDVRIYNRVVSP